MYNVVSKNKKKHRARLWGVLIGLIIISLVTATVIIVHKRSVQTAQKKSGEIPTVASPESKGDSGRPTKANDEQPVESATNQQKEAAGTTQPRELLTPSGNLVSNHFPGQNDTSTAMQSVCNTTPGASCDIKFTNDEGVVKNLGAKVTNADGVAVWTWDIDGSNLGPGSWTVTAVAELGEKTKTVTDNIKLEVQ